ncbi:hypothetical protein BGZ65_012235, partial [Modicella reniformis]
IAISPDESVVALARGDTLTTYYANSGIEINTRKFLDYKVEYVTFHGQDNQLFVILRESVSFKLCSRILDPLQPSFQIEANQVPIPIIGKTILTFFNDESFKNKGLVCEADGSKIHCYVSYEPADVIVPRNKENLVSIAGVYYPPQVKGEETELKAGSEDTPKADSEERSEAGSEERPKNEASGEAMEEHQRVLNVKPRGELNEDKLYEVKVERQKEPFQDGAGSMYWVLGVEVVERDSIQDFGKVVFSFVPEPWMRVSTTDVPQADKLQSVYFLPGGSRFVVAGMQTLQVWSFPTDNNKDFSLDFIWSCPRTSNDPANKQGGKVDKSESVGQYYHCIRSTRIYQDLTNNAAAADIELANG